MPASELKKYLERGTPELAIVDGIEQDPEINNGLPSVKEPVFGSAKPTRVDTGVPPGKPEGNIAHL